MVLTRRQEAMLKKQYKVGEWEEDESPPVVCADGTSGQLVAACRANGYVCR